MTTRPVRWFPRLIVSAFLCAWVAADAASAATTSPTRAPVTFAFGKGVSPEDEVLVREGIRLAQDETAALFGHDVRRPVAVAVSSPAGGSHGENVVRDATISLNTGNFRDAAPADRVRLVVHEYVHVWQADAGGSPPESGRLGPAWLVEGSANFAAFRALADVGLVRWADAHEYLVLLANGVRAQEAAEAPAVPPLRELTDEASLVGPGVGCCSYAVATLAVERLTKESGPAALGRYFEAIGQGEDWRAAFATVFGQDPDAFSDTFETERAELLTPSGRDETGLLVTPRFNHNPSTVTIPATAVTVVRGQQTVLRGTTTNGAHCTLTIAAADGHTVQTEPAFADAAGGVFWLWAVPLALSNAATATVSCGGTPVSIAVLVGCAGKTLCVR
ncbi:MAG TPA: hypothetical protein VH482_33890 [Thermomicrobiales bacterium]|jgi:hypothetical protein